jgi:hypothetical protein
VNDGHEKIDVSVNLPLVGSVVHYVSYGTPGGEYTQKCRAATVTEVGAWRTIETIDAGEGSRILRQERDHLGLSLEVHNPTGLFFNEKVPYCPGEISEVLTELCAGQSYCGGSWHHVVVPEVTGGNSD